MVESFLENRHHIKQFSHAMEEKMGLAADKGRGGWSDKEFCSQDDLSRMLLDHVEKGDPIDVANFCMMLHQRGERISVAAHGDDWTSSEQTLERVAKAIARAHINFDMAFNGKEEYERHIDFVWKGFKGEARAALGAITDTDVLRRD